MQISPFLQHVLDELGRRLRATVTVESISPEYGGSINESYQLCTDQGKFFLKRNSSIDFPGMFKAEAYGLQFLKKYTDMMIPEVLADGEFQGTGFLVLEYLNKGSMSPSFWEEFGRSLARMHQHTQNTYGLEHDNYIGSLPQSNKNHTGWHSFFIEERLQPLLKRAIDKGKLGEKHNAQFESLFKRIPELIPEERPALVHGDLWSGNFMPAENGKVALYDPAIYFGHREMDIAMAHLFGGFHISTWKAYHEEFPLTPKWQERIDLHNLYPLLVHINLFGATYVRQVESILSRLV